MVHPNSLKNLKPFKRGETSIYQKLGGSRKTVAKRRALIALNFNKRKCVNCNYFDICYVGQSLIGAKRLQDIKDLTMAIEITCKLPAWTINVISEINAFNDFNQLEKLMLSRMILGIDNFQEQYRFSQLLFQSMLKNKMLISKGIIYSEEEEKEEMEITIVHENKDKNNKIDGSVVK